MTDGDRITRDGQLQWGDVLIDASGFENAGDDADAVMDPAGVAGLALPTQRTTRIELPASAGEIAGQDLWGPRKPALSKVAVPASAIAKVLAAMAPRGPAGEDELVWQGLGWPTGRRFRSFARPDRCDETFDVDAAAGFPRPALSWECFDPFAYAFDPITTDPIDAGSSTTITSAGGWDTTRITVTWNGPITSPGIRSDAIDGATFAFPGLVLADGQQIIARFHAWTARTVASNHFTTRELWATAIGAGPSATVAPPFVWLRLVPGDQLVHSLGTGDGTMTVEYFDAHATPALP